jgi:hypothetical protein
MSLPIPDGVGPGLDADVDAAADDAQAIKAMEDIENRLSEEAVKRSLTPEEEDFRALHLELLAAARAGNTPPPRVEEIKNAIRLASVRILWPKLRDFCFDENLTLVRRTIEILRRVTG